MELTKEQEVFLKETATYRLVDSMDQADLESYAYQTIYEYLDKLPIEDVYDDIADNFDEKILAELIEKAKNHGN